MLSDNTKVFQKNRGLTQEELAIRVNVVRQTVSKWEKGLSVPDAELFQRLAEVLEVSVSDLLGAPEVTSEERSQLAEQLSRINEQLAIKNRRSRRIWKIAGWILVAVVILLLLNFLT